MTITFLDQLEQMKSYDAVKLRSKNALPPFVKSYRRNAKRRRLHLFEKRDKAVENHNTRTNVQPVIYEVDDFVLILKVQPQKHQKAFAIWTGPYRIISFTNPQVVEVEHLLAKRKLLLTRKESNFTLTATPRSQQVSKKCSSIKIPRCILSKIF